MFDHVALVVRDFAVSKAFYEKALAPLGVRPVGEFGSSVGFGRDGVDLWIGATPPSFWNAEHKVSAAPVHIAIAARSREEVDAFYEAAIAAGGRDLGKPGPRPIYHADYYGAFVLDPDGNNLEAVFHGQ